MRSCARSRQSSDSPAATRESGWPRTPNSPALVPARLTAAVGFAYGGWEYARVLVHPTGRVSVHVGTADHGQGHATSYAQIAADTLGLPPDDIDVVEGDTARVEFGQGTFNSRSLPVGGSAVHDCCEKVLAKAAPHRRPYAEDGC